MRVALGCINCGIRLLRNKAIDNIALKTSRCSWQSPTAPNDLRKYWVNVRLPISKQRVAISTTIRPPSNDVSRHPD